MPARSKAELRYLFANKPAVAREMAAATPSIRALPERVRKRTGKGKRLAEAARRRRRHSKGLSGPPRASGGTVTGAATSSTRVGY